MDDNYKGNNDAKENIKNSNDNKTGDCNDSFIDYDEPDYDISDEDFEKSTTPKSKESISLEKRMENVRGYLFLRIPNVSEQESILYTYLDDFFYKKKNGTDILKYENKENFKCLQQLEVKIIIESACKYLTKDKDNTLCGNKEKDNAMLEYFTQLLQIGNLNIINEQISQNKKVLNYLRTARFALAQYNPSICYDVIKEYCDELRTLAPDFDSLEEIKLSYLTTMHNLNTVIFNVCNAGYINAVQQIELSKLIRIIRNLTNNDLDNIIGINNNTIIDDTYKNLLKIDYLNIKKLKRFLDIIKKHCNKNNLAFVKEYQILLKYLLYIYVDNVMSMAIENDIVTNVIQNFATSTVSNNNDCIKLIAKELLLSIDKYNKNENALDTVTSLIMENMERLLFKKYYPNTTANEIQDIKNKHLNKAYIAVNMFDMEKLINLNNGDLKDCLGLNINIPDINKREYYAFEHKFNKKFNQSTLNNIRDYVYALIDSELKTNESLLKKLQNRLTEVIKDCDEIITFNSITYQLNYVLTIIFDNLKYDLGPDFYNLKDKIWNEKISPYVTGKVDKLFLGTLRRILSDEVFDYYLKHTVFKYIASNKGRDLVKDGINEEQIKYSKTPKLQFSKKEQNPESQSNQKKLAVFGDIKSPKNQKQIINFLDNRRVIKLHLNHTDKYNNNENNNINIINNEIKNNNGANKNNNILDDLRNYEFDDDYEDSIDNYNFDDEEEDEK